MHIKTNSDYRIAGFHPTIRPEWRQKLFTVGIVPGAVIRVIRIAPLGDPVQIMSGRISLAVRQSDLAALRLEACS